MTFYTPLRYPGGKSKLSYYVKAVIEENDLQGGNYVEPYAGGAGVALELLMIEYVKKIFINDIDPCIYGFWYSVLNNTDSLCRLITDTPVNMDTWRLQKQILNNSEKHDVLELGFAAFFLNRTNRSGILKAGVIGGKEQSGKWKMDARFNKVDLINRIEKIASYKKQIELCNEDAVDFIGNLPEENHNKALVYLDPPYYLKGQGLYRNFYEHEDHVRVMESIYSSNISNWIVSYDNTDEIKEIYKNFKKIEYSLQYTAQDKKVGSEVMIFSDNIKIPELQIGKFSTSLKCA